MNRIDCRFCNVKEPTREDCAECEAEWADMKYEQMKDRRDEKVTD